MYSPSAAARKRPPRAPRALGPHIQYILKQSDAHYGFWGIEVVRLRDKKTLFKLNADHLFAPASNMKLFTTAAALEKLGPNFVYRTTVESGAPPDTKGSVGDVILVGRGDPNLSGRVLPYHLKTERRLPSDLYLRELADQVTARGVREVRGDIVADDTYFLDEPVGHEWAEEDLEWGYGAPVTALAFNDNELVLHIQPGPSVGAKAAVLLEPINDYYQVDNRLMTVEAGGPQQIHVERAPGSRQLNVWGQVPLGSSVDDETLSIQDPPELIGEIFLKQLEARSIRVRGHVTVQRLTRMDAASQGHTLAAPPARVVLAEHDSLPLQEDVTVTNKVSQNLHAEMMLRTLGREVKHFGSVSNGLDVLREFVAQVGVPEGEISFDDGSGLSRQTLLAPEAVIMLLEYMSQSPRFQVFYDSLPVAGVDGTLADRFHGTVAEGNIHAKTGTLTHANALSGYMNLYNGERLAFSIIANADPVNSEVAEDAIDQIALAIYEKFDGHRTVVKARRSTKRKIEPSNH